MVTPGLRQLGRHGYDSGSDQEPGLAGPRSEAGNQKPQFWLARELTINRKWQDGGDNRPGSDRPVARRPELLPRAINIIAKALPLP